MASKEPKQRWLVLDAEATGDADFTATTMLAGLIPTLRDQGVTFGVAEANGRMTESLQRAGLDQVLGTDKVFPSVDTAVQAYLAAYPEGVIHRGASAGQA